MDRTNLHLHLWSIGTNRKLFSSLPSTTRAITYTLSSKPQENASGRTIRKQKNARKTQPSTASTLPRQNKPESRHPLSCGRKHELPTTTGDDVSRTVDESLSFKPQENASRRKQHTQPQSHTHTLSLPLSSKLQANPSNRTKRKRKKTTQATSRYANKRTPRKHRHNPVQHLTHPTPLHQHFT